MGSRCHVKAHLVDLIGGPGIRGVAGDVSWTCILHL